VLIDMFGFSRDYTGVCAALLLCGRGEWVSWRWVLRELWGGGDTWSVVKSVWIILHEDVMIVLAPLIVGRV
jgi:hypothetical protein